MKKLYRVLIIEDDMVIGKSIANYLNKWNYESKFVTDFRNIIDEFLAFDPQLVLLDISLPFFKG